MKNKRKFYFGNNPIGGKVIRSRRVARQITSKYHEIQSDLANIKSHPSSSGSKKRLQVLKEELQLIGGIEAYQQASVISTRYFSTSKWIISTLKKLIADKLVEFNNKKPRVLEVGAINCYLKQTHSLQVRAIDLHSQHSSIEECDFFSIEPMQDYDVVVCSMVINCVPKPSKRGDMLLRLLSQFHNTGVLFLILPIRCIKSPLVGMEEFETLLEFLGTFQLIPKRITPKLVFFILGKKQNKDISTKSDKVHEFVGSVSNNSDVKSRLDLSEDYSWIDNLKSSIHWDLKDKVSSNFITSYDDNESDNNNSKVFSITIPKFIL